MVELQKLFLVLVTILIVITGCQPNPQKREGSVQQYELIMPETMPEDFDFSVSFGYGKINRNEINTYDGTVTKDLMANGTVTASITLAPEEKREIYNKMREINVMGTQDLIPSLQNCTKTPFNEDEWRITVEGNLKIFSWTDKQCQTTSDANQLLDLREYIMQIVEQKEAYRSLPVAEGGYD